MNHEFLIIFGMVAVTFSARYPVLAFVSNLKLPSVVLQALKFVPSAVLTAIIIPAILIDGQQINLNINNSSLIASFVAGFIAWKTKNLLLTIIIGMGVFWFWKYFVFR